MIDSAEDLRQYYITPMYLETMRQRAMQWTDEFIELQMQQFRTEHPTYPELQELLEGELHRRRLNQIKRKARSLKTPDLESALKKQTDPDSREVIQTELLIRQGMRRLPDSEENARIQ
ncbi:MAG: hypothetical protein KDK37_13090 [Leptospiraceae bacterium]|nr:hypothetical protein [Leptospiraceae bacterium]MCB1305215.1 hypothetical protein [Leptospiraceae bacterium]